MPEYFDLFTESENERYKGYNEFLQCVNKSLVASDLKNVRETIKLVQNTINDEINKKEDDTATPSVVERILDSKGNLLPGPVAESAARAGPCDSRPRDAAG